MATWTDRTAFRTITMDGELSHDSAPQAGLTLYDFEVYANTFGDDGVEPGEIAQWYIPRTSDLLAECNHDGGVTTYPAASIFD
jgi:hypothetical protein